MTTRRPIIAGIVGDSAAGKTTLAKGLVNLLGPERVTHVCSDDYHKYDRDERARRSITALHPDCVLKAYLEARPSAESLMFALGLLEVA